MRRSLEKKAWTLALVSLAAGALLTGCEDDSGPLVCIKDQDKTANPAHDHECAGNTGCKDLGAYEPGCRCDYCADERCVRVVCSDYFDLGLDIGMDGSFDAAKADAGLDAAKADASGVDAAADALVKLDTMLDAASSAYKDLEWELSSYQGGFNPHTTTSKLKAGALVLETSSLAGGVVKSCKATLTAPQLAALLAEAGKVSWSGVKPSYVPGTSCSYPGDSGDLKITLIPAQGAQSTISSKWCAGGGKPQGVPADLALFLAAVDKLHAAACP